MFFLLVIKRGIKTGKTEKQQLLLLTQPMNVVEWVI